MKQLKVLFALFFLSNLFIGFTDAFSNMAPQKIALIVAVGNYPANSGWQSLSSNQDADLVKNALLTQGFMEGNIFIIRDKQATKQGILNAIEHTLRKRATRGSTVVFHFSGHGQQIVDDDGDEKDNLDEAIVPYDSPYKYQPGYYEGQNLIRDEELGTALNRVRSKIGKKGHLLVLLDACHSGTGTRGLTNVRGTKYIMGLEEGVKPTASDTNQLERERDVYSGRKNLAPIISFFASSAKELNYEATDREGNNVGSLSYAFCRAFSNASITSTYGEIFDAIRMDMNALTPRQNPQAEGDLALTLLGGKINGISNSFSIKMMHDAQTLTVKGGILMGLNKGATLGFYPLGTIDFERTSPIATGTVMYANAFEADIKLNTSSSKDILSKSKAILLEKNYGSISIRIQQDIRDVALRDYLTQELSKYKVIQWVDHRPDLYLEVDNEYSSGVVQLVTRSEQIVCSTPKTENYKILIKQLANSLEGYIRVTYLKNLASQNTRLLGDLQFIPIKTKQVGAREVEIERYSIDSKKNQFGEISMKQDIDRVKIQVNNRGRVPFYYSILDIQPDYKINLIIPQIGYTAEEYYVEPGKTQETDLILKFLPPLGTEVFKLIVSRTPMDLSLLQKTRGESIRGKEEHTNPFELLFAETFITSYPNRGGVTTSVPAGDVGVASLIFKIE